MNCIIYPGTSQAGVCGECGTSGAVVWPSVRLEERHLWRRNIYISGVNALYPDGLKAIPPLRNGLTWPLMGKLELTEQAAAAGLCQQTQSGLHRFKMG